MKIIPVRQLKSIEDPSAFSDSFRIRSIEPLLEGKDKQEEVHRHDFFHLLFLKKGKGKHEIDFISYDISDRSIFFLRPGQAHRIMLKAGSEGFVLQFNRDFYYPKEDESKQLLRRASNKNLCKPDKDRFEKLRSVLTYIFQEYTSKQENYQQIIKANLGIFFIEYIRQSTNGPKKSNNENPYQQQRLEEFLELVEKNSSTHKQVAAYAEMLNLSPYQLNAITKSILGKTCSEIINAQIILETKRYLLTTSNQVSQIADHLGYDDVSYFIRFFKKHTGSSPEAFRNNFK